jgi:branched-chain amino acid transport system substrate-binding protein
MRKVLVILAAMVLSAMGCEKGKTSSSAPSGDEPIRIGADLPLSGALAPYGKNVLDGVNLRLQEINDAGGINGRKIVLVVEDNRGEPVESRSAYRKLAQIDKVSAVIGPITSTNALAVKLDVEQCKVPLLSPTATNDTVTANTHYLFRACFKDSFQGQIVANYAAKNFGVKKAAILIDKNSDYSKGLSASFQKAFEAAGGKIVAAESYQQKDTDFGTQLVRIKNAGAELIFVPGYPPEVPQIIRQAKVVGFAGRLCGADGWDSEAVLNAAGENIEGCFIVGAFSPQDTRPIVKNFVEKASRQSGRTPGTFEALGYDSLILLAEAMKASGTAPQEVADGMRRLSGVEAVSGKISITPSGDAHKSAVVLRIVPQGDKYVTQYLATVEP